MVAMLFAIQAIAICCGFLLGGIYLLRLSAHAEVRHGILLRDGVTLPATVVDVQRLSFEGMNNQTSYSYYPIYRFETPEKETVHVRGGYDFDSPEEVRIGAQLEVIYPPGRPEDAIESVPGASSHQAKLLRGLGFGLIVAGLFGLLLFLLFYLLRMF